MPAMLQDGKVIVIVLVAYLLTEASSASSDDGKCRHCKEAIQTLLKKNNLLRVFEEKSPLPENFFRNINEENVPTFIKYCKDNCIKSGDKTTHDDDNSIRTKRALTEGIYQYFSPPFSHMTDGQSELGISEIAQGLKGYSGRRQRNFWRAMDQYHPKEDVNDRKPDCECLKEQEESIKRLAEMVGKYAEGIIEGLRKMLREEITNHAASQRQKQVSSIGHQQNYFMISFPESKPRNPGRYSEVLQSTISTPPTPTTPHSEVFQSTTSTPATMTTYIVTEATSPGVTQTETNTPERLPEISTAATTMTTTNTGYTVDDAEAHATSEAQPDLTTTDVLEKGREYTEEITTEVTIDLPESNVMRRRDNGFSPDCDKKDQNSPQYLPALLQALKPKTT